MENNKDGVWRTIHGTPIFIKKGQSIADAFNERFGKSIDAEKLGNLDTKLYSKVLGKELDNYEVIITPDRIKHIEEEHPKVWDKYRDKVPNILNHPDLIFEGNKPQRIQLVKKVDKQVSLIVWISTNSKTNNKIITMFEITDEKLNAWEKSRKVLYKKAK